VAKLLIGNIGLLVTPQSANRDQRTREVQSIAQAAILVRDGRIVAVGAEKDVRSQLAGPVDEYDALGRLVLPGLVDAHTHPVFVGNRATEFYLRNAGKSYSEIAAAGGGIQASARRIAEASVEQIVAESLPRFHRSLTCGVTTIEAKTGYGLEWRGEVKLLDALAQIRQQIPQRVRSTFLIHALPESHTGRRTEYVDLVISGMIPVVSGEKRASMVDVFCETGAFSSAETERMLVCAREHGLQITVHANQFGHSGGAKIAAALGAQSVSHVEFLSDEEIDALAAAEVTAVVLPACVFFLGTIPYPPVRKMLERGMRVAVATDMNPGSAMTESLPFALTAAAVYCKMTPEELLWSATLDAARALGVDDEAGSIEAGKLADLSFWDLPDLPSLAYHFGTLRASAVAVGGRIAWEDSDASPRH
jgi:imidazolonepropionase